MIKNRINLRINDQDVLHFIDRKSNDRKISASKFINDCVRKCMDSENYEYGIEAINKKLDKLTEQNGCLKNATQLIGDYVTSNYVIGLITLQGRINEYKAKGLDPYKYYSNNVHEVLEKLDVGIRSDVEKTPNEDNND